MKRKYRYTIGGELYEVEIDEVVRSAATVTVNGVRYEVQRGDQRVAPQSGQPPVQQPIQQPAQQSIPQPAPQTIPQPVPATPVAEVSQTEAPAVSSEPEPATPTPSTSGSPVIAPLPGVIVELLVAEGQQVKQGERLVILEAMKMENDVKADRDGVVQNIAVAVGESVQEGTTLLTIG